MATDGSWPILLLLLTALAIIQAENLSESTPSTEEDYNGSTSPSPPLEETTNRLTAQVEPFNKVDGGQEQYDVIDVMASTGTVAGKQKSGQTTRIYTTGDVDDRFWLKHLGEDFKHAIHLQVGGTNEEYNRLINQTNQNGVHEEVHHEYLPGAERPGSGAPPPHPLPPARQSRPAYRQGFDNRAMAMKQQYLINQQTQQSHPSQQRYNYAHQHTQHYAQPAAQQHTHQYPQQTPHRNTYTKPQSYKPQSYIINSSEDQLHAAQSNTAPVRSGGGDPPKYEEEVDSFGSQLNFKSPFNDYGSRPTRDLTYLLFKRGL
ncbi:uncharacterized protein At1g21580 [Drosophila rhopaloa]|uniref:Uncharacterized protein n=1 Tax=Drosophila rhopaloa TaxID=1041015 RepID=A0ABM5JDN6_DRORH|nr:uncharacterized protein At1g21580 [Drosophila rhopaloa]